MSTPSQTDSINEFLAENGFPAQTSSPIADQVKQATAEMVRDGYVVQAEEFYSIVQNLDDPAASFAFANGYVDGFQQLLESRNYIDASIADDLGPLTNVQTAEGLTIGDTTHIVIGVHADALLSSGQYGQYINLLASFEQDGTTADSLFSKIREQTATALESGNLEQLSSFQAAAQMPGHGVVGNYVSSAMANVVREQSLSAIGAYPDLAGQAAAISELMQQLEGHPYLQEGLHEAVTIVSGNAAHDGNLDVIADLRNTLGQNPELASIIERETSGINTPPEQLAKTPQNTKPPEEISSAFSDANNAGAKDSMVAAKTPVQSSTASPITPKA